MRYVSNVLLTEASERAEVRRVNADRVSRRAYVVLATDPTIDATSDRTRRTERFGMPHVITCCSTPLFAIRP